MGFFSKLFGLEKQEVKKEEATSRIEAAAPAQKSRVTDENYFAQLLTEENFQGYTVERNVHVQRFDPGAHPACYPVSFLFLKDSVPVLAVLVMQTNQWRAMIAKGSYEVLDNHQIPYIRFFKEFNNEETYVLDRVREALNGPV